MRRTTGNALTEYGVIGSLVLLASLGALTAFSGTLSDLLGQSRSDMKANILASKSAAAKNPFKDPPPVAPVIIGGTGTGATGPVSSAPGGLTAQPISTDLKSTIETLGANGTTQYLSDQIAAYAKKFLDEGKIDKQTYDVLVDLANQGHKIGDVQGLIEKAADGSKSAEAFEDKNITWEGQEYSMKDLGLLIGWQSKQPDEISDPTNPPGGAGDVMQRFIDLLGDAQAAGFKSPEAEAVITELAGQIIFMGELVENFNCETVNGRANPNEHDDLVVSEATHYNSTGICEAGGKKDNGQYCKG